MRPAEISLIISTYESPAALEKVLDGVARQSEMPGEIAIADDGSGTPTRGLITHWQKKLTVPLRHFWHDDAGFRKTIILNKAIAAAQGKYVVLLDGDCVPHAKFIIDHAELAGKGFWVQGRRCFVRKEFTRDFAAEDTTLLCLAFAGKITGWTKGIRLPLPLVRRDTGQRGIIGCNMGIWRDDLLSINGFDEDYTGWGGEDSDLGTRLYNLGRIRKFVYGRAIVYHLNHPAVSDASFKANTQRLAETMRAKKVRCERGVAQYLA